MFHRKMNKFRVIKRKNKDINGWRYEFVFIVQRAYTFFGKECWEEIDWWYTEQTAVDQMNCLYKELIGPTGDEIIAVAP